MKKFIRISDGHWPITEADLDPLMIVPSSNFKPNEEEYTEPRQWAKPAIDKVSQKVVEIQPALIDGIWTQQWKVKEKYSDPTEKAAAVEAHRVLSLADAASAARAERDSKLAQSDYMGLSDGTMSVAWGTYRQALRDVPSQAGFPDTIDWPTSPQ